MKKYKVNEITGWHIAPIAFFFEREKAEEYIALKKADNPPHVNKLFSYEICEIDD